MKMYLSIFRVRFINSLQYRAVVIGAIMKGFLYAFMEIMAYAALYRSGQFAFPFSFSQMVSYVWVQETFLVLFVVVFGDGEIYSAIGEGSIAYDLVRPVSLYGRWFCQSAANRLAFTVVNCLPVLLLAFFMPEPFRASLPLSVGQALLFLVSTVLAFSVVVSFAMLMYVSLFYTISQRGVRIIVTAVTSFLSGGIVPLPFFPAPILAVVRLLPFAAMQNMPLQIYAGALSGADALRGIALQIVWLAALVLLGRLAMRRALRKVIVQGG